MQGTTVLIEWNLTFKYISVCSYFNAGKRAASKVTLIGFVAWLGQERAGSSESAF
jgi:hypothetical protein